METYSSLLEAFDALNKRKREDPDELPEEEMGIWQDMRRKIEHVLFKHSIEPEKDTRKFIRVPVSLSARYWSKNELKDRYIPVFGEGGLQIVTVDPLDVGTRFELEIVIAHRRLSFKVMAEVVWVKSDDDPAGRCMGVKFVELTYEQKRAIYDLVDDTLKQRLLERRRFGRVEARLQVQFVYADGFFELETEDLSIGGMFIATQHLLSVGERLRLVLHLPGAKPAIKVVAEVARVVDEARQGQPSGIGVKFVNLSDDDRKVIQGFLALQVSRRQEPKEMTGTLSERRAHARLEQRIKLRFHSDRSAGISFSRDISSGGVFIQTLDDPPPMMSPIQVTLVHPVTLQSLDLRGKVVRVVKPDASHPEVVAGIGVAFDPLSYEQRKELDGFLVYYTQFDRKLSTEAGGTVHTGDL